MPPQSSLLLLLLLFPTVSIQKRCDEGGNQAGSCDRIKQEKYQIRGVKVLPMWQYVLNTKPIYKKHDASYYRTKIEGSTENMKTLPYFSVDQEFAYRKQNLFRAKARGVKQQPISIAPNYLNWKQPNQKELKSTSTTNQILSYINDSQQPATSIWIPTPPSFWVPSIAVPASPSRIIQDEVVEYTGRDAPVGDAISSQLSEAKIALKRAANKPRSISDVNSSEEDQDDEEESPTSDLKKKQKGGKKKKDRLAKQDDLKKKKKKGAKKKQKTASDNEDEEDETFVDEDTTENKDQTDLNDDQEIVEGAGGGDLVKRPKGKKTSDQKNGVKKSSQKKRGRKSGKKKNIEDNRDESVISEDLGGKTKKKKKTRVSEEGDAEEIVEETLGGKKKGKLSKGKISKKQQDEEEEAEEDYDSEDEEEIEEKDSKPASGSTGEDKKLINDKHTPFDNNSIRNNPHQGALKDTEAKKYKYPPKTDVPLPTCFHNPSGYVCCNLKLNNLIEETYEKLKATVDYNPCNIGKMARAIQSQSQDEFDHPFESIVSLGDFAQNVHFAGDMVCKLEIDGKFMLAYATPYNADELPENEGGPLGETGTRIKRRSLPIHNFRM